MSSQSYRTASAVVAAATRRRALCSHRRRNYRKSSRRLAQPRTRCFDRHVTDQNEVPRIVSASREISAGPAEIFELIADPAEQPRWDGNDNLAEAATGQRVRAAGAVFSTTLTNGAVRDNHVVEFAEGSRIAWRPSEPGKEPPGHLWRWELEPVGAGRTRVTHTYDWTTLTDEKRQVRARATTADKLSASIDRLAELAQQRAVAAQE